MTAPILFFDIDGCLHPHGTARANPDGTIYRGPNDGLFVWCAPLEDLLVQNPAVMLVCHSSWRHRYDRARLLAQLSPALAARTIGITSLMPDRYDSIRDYVAVHQVKSYKILDDDAWAFPSQLPELVLVDSTTGISTSAAKLLLKEAFRDLVSDGYPAIGAGPG